VDQLTYHIAFYNRMVARPCGKIDIHWWRWSCGYRLHS